MSEPTLQDQIAKLPVWARNYIKQLQQQTEPNNHEVRQLRQRIDHEIVKRKRTQERLDALEHLMTCAAKGGHETAQAYVDRIINEYSSEPEEEQ